MMNLMFKLKYKLHFSKAEQRSFRYGIDRGWVVDKLPHVQKHHEAHMTKE